MIVSVKEGQRSNCPTMGQRLQVGGEVRIVNQPNGFFLNTVEKGQRGGRSPAPHMIAVFKCGAYLGFVQSQKLGGGEESSRAE